MAMKAPAPVTVATAQSLGGMRNISGFMTITMDPSEFFMVHLYHKKFHRSRDSAHAANR
jgi:ABC-type enterochelin transport system permease subunit